MTQQDRIETSPSGTLFAGPKAVDLYRVTLVKQAIEMHLKFGGRMQITRGFTITKALKMASEYTGKKYKRTEHQRAIDDLKALMGERAKAIHITHIGE